MVAELSALFRHNNYDEAYKIAIFEKDAIIEKIYNIISKITYTENGKKYYTYSNFDIITDLNDIYYKILNRIKKEIQEKEKILKIELLERLENKLIRLFELSSNKYCASIVVKKSGMKIKIINDMSQNEHEKNVLNGNYSRVLTKVIKQYDGDIIAEKMENKHKRQTAKIKQNKSIFNQLVLGHILGDISRSLPKGFSRGKGH